jgi:methyl-accepting chemotaxis protein
MSSQEPAFQASESSRSLWVLGRRRSFLVPGNGQKKSIAVIIALAAVLIAGVDAAAWWALRVETARESGAFPELARMFAGQDRAEFLSIVATSVVGLLAICAIALFETHRIAGPLYNLRRAMTRMGEIGPSVRVYFRAGDRFQDLQEEFNAMAESMESRFMAIDAESGRLADAIRSEAAHLAGRQGGSDESTARLNFLADEVGSLFARVRRGALAPGESGENAGNLQDGSGARPDSRSAERVSVHAPVVS